MPFVDGAGRPLGPLGLDYTGGIRFRTTQEFAWVDPLGGERHRVPAGFGTDLASVPPFLWGLIAGYGRQTLPAILHDRLSSEIDHAPAEERLQRRAAADAIFRRALEEAGLPSARATVMWTAVRGESYWRHARGLGVVLVVQLALGVIACIAAVGSAVAGHPLGLLLLLAPALGALAWGRRVAFVLPAAYLAALYSPLLAAAALASGSEYLVALVLYLLGGRRGAPPTPGPTLRADRIPVRGGRASRRNGEQWER